MPHFSAQPHHGDLSALRHNHNRHADGIRGALGPPHVNQRLLDYVKTAATSSCCPTRRVQSARIHARTRRAPRNAEEVSESFSSSQSSLPENNGSGGRDPDHEPPTSTELRIERRAEVLFDLNNTYPARDDFHLNRARPGTRGAADGSRYKQRDMGPAGRARPPPLHTACLALTSPLTCLLWARRGDHGPRCLFGRYSHAHLRQFPRARPFPCTLYGALLRLDCFVGKLGDAGAPGVAPRRTQSRRWSRPSGPSASAATRRTQSLRRRRPPSRIEYHGDDEFVPGARCASPCSWRMSRCRAVGSGRCGAISFFFFFFFFFVEFSRSAGTHHGATRENTCCRSGSRVSSSYAVQRSRCWCSTCAIGTAPECDFVLTIRQVSRRATSSCTSTTTKVVCSGSPKTQWHVREQYCACARCTSPTRHHNHRRRDHAEAGALRR